jgi:hypothetical protein
MSPGTTNQEVAVQGLIDGYLDSIGHVLERSRLSGAEAASILDDVRTQILETLAARARGAPTLADAEAVIAQLDPPESYAAAAAGEAGVELDPPEPVRLRRAGWAALVVAGLTIPSFIIDLVATFDRDRMVHLLATVPIEVAFITLYPFAVLTLKDLLTRRARVAGISAALYVCVICNVIFSLANILVPAITLGEPEPTDLDGLHMLLSLLVVMAWGIANAVLGIQLLQGSDSLWGMQKLLAGVSLATGLGQMATILILPIPLTILLLTAQIMLMGFVMLRSARQRTSR